MTWLSFGFHVSFLKRENGSSRSFLDTRRSYSEFCIRREWIPCRVGSLHFFVVRVHVMLINLNEMSGEGNHRRENQREGKAQAIRFTVSIVSRRTQMRERKNNRLRATRFDSIQFIVPTLRYWWRKLIFRLICSSKGITGVSRSQISPIKGNANVLNNRKINSLSLSPSHTIQQFTFMSGVYFRWFSSPCKENQCRSETPANASAFLFFPLWFCWFAVWQLLHRSFFPLHSSFEPAFGFCHFHWPLTDQRHCRSLIFPDEHFFSNGNATTRKNNLNSKKKFFVDLMIIQRGGKMDERVFVDIVVPFWDSVTSLRLKQSQHADFRQSKRSIKGKNKSLRRKRIV